MIRLGIIGYGRRIHGVLNARLREIEPDIKIAGIVDPDEKGARQKLCENDKKTAFYPSLQELVRRERPDALAVGTRCNLHAPYAIEAEKYKLPLYLEKPVAITMKQARAMEDAFENSKCPVLVSFPLRASPLCVLVREHLENGATGSPEHISAHNYVPYGTVYFERPYSDYSVTRGLFLQKATHDFDYISMLMGSKISRIAAARTMGRVFGGDRQPGLLCSACAESGNCPESPANRQKNRSGGKLSDHTCLFGKDCGSPEDGMNEDSSSALIEFSDGRHGIYTQVFFSRRDAASRGAVISGYEGTLRFDWYKNKIEWTRHHAPFTAEITADRGASHFGGDAELARNFIGMIKDGAAPAADIRDGIQSVYACLAAQKSAENSSFEKVRILGQ